jgi:peptide/nickel transport system permease protein
VIAYFSRRLLSLIPLLFGVTALVFILLQLAPGDFLTPLRQQRDVDPKMITELSQRFGLDLPWYQQYVRWLGNMARGDLGDSFQYKVPVTELLLQRVPATLLLNLSALLFAWFLAIPLGVLAAIYQDSWFDRLSATLAYAALSLPEFFLALLAVWFAAQTGWFPLGGLTSIAHEFYSPLGRFFDVLWHLVLPTLVLGLGSIAGLMRIMRANFLDYLRAEFVQTARAKGLPEGLVMFRHVLRNALNPFISSIGYAFAGLLSGSLLVEQVMNYPGLGRLVFQAFTSEDIFVVLGSVTIGCILLVIGNLLSDILLAYSDPRIRLEARK